MAEATAAEVTEETAVTETGIEETTEAPAEKDVAANGADAAASGTWRESIQDEKLRAHAEKFASVEELAKAHLGYRKDLSTAIIPLGKKPTDEQVAAYRKAAGVPETAEGYEFATPEGYELTEADTALRSSAAETFHKLNIPAETAKGLGEWWDQMTAQAQKAQIDADKAYAAESEAALKAEWPGKEFKANKAFADRAAAKVFGDELEAVRNIETKDGRFILDHPAFVKMLAQVGREMAEGRLGTVMTEGDRDGIQSQIEDLEKQIDKARTSNDGEKANDLYQKQQRLYEKMYGTAPIVGSEGRAA